MRRPKLDYVCMPRIALGLEYDGSRFHGWQSQRSGLRTVQACLEQALSKVADEPVNVVCAGRTDAGVHGLAQVVHFDCCTERLPRAWTLGANSHLPIDVSMHWARSVPAAFHARYSALARRYRYVILNRAVRPALERGRVTWFHYPLDEARMHAAGQSLLGEHDFSAFRARDCQSRTPWRDVRELTVWRDNDRVVLEIEANAFLHHMVRNIVGVLLAVGRGVRPVAWVAEVLAGRNRAAAGVTAPAAGLYLQQVRYPGSFELPTALAAWGFDLDRKAGATVGPGG